MKIRKFLLTAVAFGAIASVSLLNAQEQKKGRGGMPTPEQRIERLEQAVGSLSADQKEKIKELLKANKDQFLADTKQLRTDIRDRVKELVGELKAGNVKGAGTEGAGHGRRGGN
ncbi:MAG: hypothetical protein WCP53_12425 [Verrucomicrobiota bacterium]